MGRFWRSQVNFKTERANGFTVADTVHRVVPEFITLFMKEHAYRILVGDEAGTVQ